MKFLILFLSYLTFSSSLDSNFTPVKHILKTSRLSEKEIRKFESASTNGRIINGFPVTTADRFPFVTDNLVTWPDRTQNICTGSILSILWTITARQCML